MATLDLYSHMSEGYNVCLSSKCSMLKVTMSPRGGGHGKFSCLLNVTVL